MNVREGLRAVVVIALVGGLPARVSAESQSEKIERLERELDELKGQIQELKREQATQAPAPKAAEPTAETASAKTALLERVQIGGYGSVRFEANSARGVDTTFTLRRFVLTADAAIAPKLRSYFELEFERFRKLELDRKVEVANGGLTIRQAIEGTTDSEISLEQAFLEYELAEPLKVRAGALLVPLGRFNLSHDDNRWDLPRRSLVDRGVPVLPVEAAWDELGAGFIGDVAIGERGSIGYQFYVVNGALLEPEVESELEGRNEEGGKEAALEAEFSPSTGTFAEDHKNAKAVTGRLVYSPALGHEIAGSFYRGRYTPDFLPSEAITAFAVDGLSISGPFEIEAEYVHSDFGDVDRVARGFAARAADREASATVGDFETKIEFALDSLAQTRQGYWIEPRWRFRPAWLKRSILGRPFEDPVLTAVFRWEQAWLDGLLREVDFQGGQVTGLEKVDRRVDRLTIGGSYRPVPLVAFQLAYEFTRVDHGALGEVTNFLDTRDDKSHAFLVGAAFGF
jgi:hypothetical protein